MPSKTKVTDEPVAVRGMYRVRLTEDGRIVGDSGWKKNQVTNLGKRYYLAELISAQVNSLQIARFVLGSGTAPASSDTSLHLELTYPTYTRTTVTASILSSNVVEFRGTFASSSSHITGAQAPVLSNIGLISNTASAGTIFAGNTYTASTWNSNQDVNVSYRLTF